jgi:Holliday junction resolvasome RuvABC endonuclease subunit
MHLVCIEHFKPDDVIVFGSHHQTNRYLSKVLKMMNCIGDNSQNDTIVGIEGYAFSFGFHKTSSQSTLMELGGILRMYLSMYNHVITELSPSNVKKLFTGIGKSKKQDMYNCFQERFYLPKIEPLIGIKTNFKLSNPVEDIVDSFAIAIGMIGML